MQFSSLWVQFLRKSGLNIYVRKGAVAAERAPYKSTPRKNFRAHAGAKMLPVVMEPGVRDPRAWTGPVGMELGGMLYKARSPPPHSPPPHSPPLPPRRPP